jgi:hypothetical protein
MAYVNNWEIPIRTGGGLSFAPASSDLEPFYGIMSPLLNFKWVPPMFMLNCNLIFDQDQSDVIWEFTITCPNSCDLSEELEMNLFLMLVFSFLCSCDQSTSLGSWIESLPGFLTGVEARMKNCKWGNKVLVLRITLLLLLSPIVSRCSNLWHGHECYANMTVQGLLSDNLHWYQF